MDKWSLPSSWEWSSLEDVVDVGSHNIEPSDDPEKIFNYIALENIEKGSGRLVAFVPQKGRQIRSMKTVFNAGDVLYGKLRPYLQKTIIAPFDGVCVTDIVPLKPYGDGRFVFHYLLGPDHLAYISPLMAGIRMPRLRTGDLVGMPIPCAPLSEQRRIADKIDALQAKSRRAREALEAVGPLLEKFRQSVLAAAFRGDLTAEWRRQHPDVEPAEKLLERIRAERRARWEEAELANMRAKGIKPKDDKWKVKYTEPEPVDATGLPGLPEGWCWSTLEAVTDPVRVIRYGILKPGPDVVDGIRYVKVLHMRGDVINMEVLPRTTPEIFAKYKAAALGVGDVLLSIRGTYGRVAEVPDELDGANITQDSARIAPMRGISRFFISNYLRSPITQKFFARIAKGVAVKGINIRDIRPWTIPVAPEAEQGEIAKQVSRMVEGVASLTEVVSANGEQLEKLDQSILAKAFRGELVPQDPNDEPASVLLERIKVERGAATGRKRTRRKA